MLPDCKVLFSRGELFVVNGSCAEMKAEHFRKKKFENLECLDGLKWHFQSFLSQGPTRKRQNKSLVHQKHADFVGFSWKCADRNSAKISARGTRSPRRPNFTVWQCFSNVALNIPCWQWFLSWGETEVSPQLRNHCQQGTLNIVTLLEHRHRR